MKERDDPVFMFHRTLIMAKSANEHGTILNYDDMQMGRQHPIQILLTIPQSTHYPIAETISQKIKDEMRDLGFTDFWDYWFNGERTKALRKKEKMEEEKQKKKKKRWLS